MSNPFESSSESESTSTSKASKASKNGKKKVISKSSSSTESTKKSNGRAKAAAADSEASGTEDNADRSGDDGDDRDAKQPGSSTSVGKKRSRSQDDTSKDSAKKKAVAKQRTTSMTPEKPIAVKTEPRSDVDELELVGGSGVMAPANNKSKATVASSAATSASASFGEAQEAQFWLQFHTPAQLVHLINVASETLEIADFKIVHTKDFSGIQIFSLTTNRVVAFLADLECILMVPPPTDAPVSFRISLADFKVLLNQVSAGSVVEWGWYHNAERQTMHSYERDAGSYVRTFEIPLVMDELDPSPPFAQLHAEFRLEMEVGFLKDFVKGAKDLKADNIRIEVLEHIHANSSNVTHYLRFTAAGSMISKCIFRSHSQQQGLQQDDDGNSIPVVIQTVTSLEATQNAHADFQKNEKACTQVYNQAFPCEYFNKFVKSMNKTSLTIDLKSDDPGWIKYPLGGKSQIQMVCACVLGEGATEE
jgi:hypothetical protein